MAESRHTGQPEAVTQPKRASYLHHVRIHLDLLADSLAGSQVGCGLARRDREDISRHLHEIWSIACGAKLSVVERPAAPAAPKVQGSHVIALRPRQAT